MTGPGDPSPGRPAPASVPPRAPQAAAGLRREGRGAGAGADDRDASVRLAPREETLLDEAVVSVARRGRGPVVASVLIAAAFVLGLARPWDLLVPATVPPSVGPVVAEPGGVAGVELSGGVDDAPGAVTGQGADRTAPPAPRPALTCAYPSQWRSSTIEDWTGRSARVWKATEVVEASGPDDAAIPFEPIVAATITAIGWCAPIDGPERPPRALTASLYRIADGVATPVAYDRLEPRAPDAMGELWIPKARSVGLRPPWPMGRYVIELRSDSGRYVRYLGLELTDRVVRPEPVPSPGESPVASQAVPTP